MTCNQPMVSVVVPCLNRASLLAPTIDSIVKQQYPNIECIAVDGGSTDGTVDILRNYGDKVRWVSEPDNGHADAINKGWKMSKGEILAWLNADDCYVLPDAIAKAVAYLQENPDVDVVYGDSVTIDSIGNRTSDVIRPRKWDLTYAVRYCYYTIPQPSSFMRRRILERVGWLDPEFRYGKDHELWLRIGLVGTIKYVPILFAYVRDCPGISQQLETSRSKVRLTEKFFSNPDLPPPFNARRFQRVALSNSYLVGSLYIWKGGRCLRQFLKYLLRAFATDPVNLPYILWRVVGLFLGTILPPQWKQVMKKSLSVLGRC